MADCSVRMNMIQYCKVHVLQPYVNICLLNWRIIDFEFDTFSRLKVDVFSWLAQDTWIPSTRKHVS